MKKIILIVVVAFIGIGGYLYQDSLKTKANDMAREQAAMMEKQAMQKVESIKAETMQKGEAMMEEAKDKMMEKSEEVIGKEGTQLVEKVMDSAKVGTYTESAGVPIAGMKNILFFHASWCPTCRTADAELSAAGAKLPLGVAIHKVDYDSSSDLKKKYGVTTQHTFVHVDATGALVKKWSGGGLAEIKANTL